MKPHAIADILQALFAARQTTPNPVYLIRLNETQHMLDIVAGVVPALVGAKVHIVANEPGVPIHLVDGSTLAETLLARQGLLDLHQRLKVYEEKLLHHKIARRSKLASKLATYSAKLKHTIEVEGSRKLTLNSGGQNHVKDITRERMAAVQLETQRVRVERQQLVERQKELEHQYEDYKKQLLATHESMKTCQTTSKEAGHCTKRNPVAFSKRRSDLQEQFKDDARVCGLKL
jgi:hypothetical protein